MLPTAKRVAIHAFSTSPIFSPDPIFSSRPSYKYSVSGGGRMSPLAAPAGAGLPSDRYATPVYPATDRLQRFTQRQRCYTGLPSYSRLELLYQATVMLERLYRPTMISCNAPSTDTSSVLVADVCGFASVSAQLSSRVRVVRC